ncbi:MAG: PKD domain-containing protein, partial [Bacteroidota bacterium]
MLKTIFAGSISGLTRLVVFSMILASFVQKTNAQSAAFTSDLVMDRNCGADIVDFTITDEMGITTVKWEFGNGEPDLDDAFVANGSDVDASSTYITAGTYTITLTINEGQPTEDIQTLDITIFDAPEPVFEVTDGSNEGCLSPGMVVNFDYTSDPTDIVQWSYNFGDGTTTVYTAAGGSDGDVSHTYTSHGIYNVFLEVTDINGCVSSFFEPQYVIANATPTAAMTVGTPASCDLPIDITFTDNSTVSNTTNPDNDIAFRTWTFVKDPTGTEDTVAQSSDQNPTITFEEFATYRAILIVQTSPGLCADTVTQDFTLVQNTVDFLPASATTSCVNEAISFQDNSTDGSGTPSAYLWDFGDGNTSADQDPSYAYSMAGTFDVSLTVTFADGCQKTLEKESLIVINPDLNAAIAVDVEESCEPFTANFTATPATGIQYQWDFEYDGTTPAFDVTSTANTASYAYVANGTYSVLLRTTSSDGCVEDVVADDLIEVGTPNLDFTVPDLEREGCVGTIANFDASAT